MASRLLVAARMQLVRQVAVLRIPFRTRALALIGALAQVTGIVTWIALAIAAAFTVSMKVDLARSTIRAYAFEAYPSWVKAHPDRLCPKTLDDLDQYALVRDSIDPWGKHYYFACGPMTVPDGARGVWIMSAGPDGNFGTDDDVRSDR